VSKASTVTNAVKGERVGRRRLLGGLGAGGLAAAAAIFGRSSPAHAANWQCCNLVYAPPNISMSACLSARHYVWTCSMGSGGLWCQCCERYSSSGSINGSAGSCRYN